MRLIDADAFKDYIDCGHLRPPTEVCFSELDVCNMIDKAPTVSAESVQRWIPVSEKPKDDEERTYLVRLDSGGMRSCRWTNVNPVWTDLTTDWHWCIFDIPQYSKVVAWMDLEPYKGGDSE